MAPKPPRLVVPELVALREEDEEIARDRLDPRDTTTAPPVGRELRLVGTRAVDAPPVRQKVP
jgi:hypothetical protein